MTIKFTGSFGPITGAMSVGDVPDTFDVIGESLIYLDVDNYVSGSTWVDQSSNGYNASLSNVSLVSGHMDYSTTSSRSTITYNSAFSSASKSIVMWVRNDTPTVNKGYFSAGDSTDSYIGHDAVFESNETGAGVQFYLGGNTAFETSQLTAGVFYCLAYTYDTTEGVGRFYINNVEVGSRSETLTNFDANITLGDIPWAANHELNGAIDTFAYYDKQLVAADLTAVYELNASRYA